MKRLFIPARVKIDLNTILKKVKIKEEKVGLITTVQFDEEVKKIKNDKFVYGGPILGCNIDKILPIKDEVDAFLYIGSGDFHPLALAKLNKPIYIANPLTNKFSKISEEEIKKLEKQLKGKIIKYYTAKKLGIIVSTKPGQNLFFQALNLQKKLKKPSFLFICNDLDLNELENFPDIDLWINTACPRIEGKNIINMSDLPKE
ncbi:diphthamide synthesis protein [Candidatus Woesearchaeota archaeon]|nr:diphthamide synthesis protein [Candidatus Woesearchaeota archaeon]